MKIENLNNINNKDMEEILDTWESSVRATHDFLSEADIISIKPQVIEGAKYVSKLLCVRDKNGIIFDVDKISTLASITAKYFFEKRGYKVVKEQKVERKGFLLTNYVMEC